jgi:hypothetical protein
MDILRGPSPGMVRKQPWGRLPVYDVVRGLMARAAQPSGQQPREVQRRSKNHDRLTEPRVKTRS